MLLECNHKCLDNVRCARIQKISKFDLKKNAIVLATFFLHFLKNFDRNAADRIHQKFFSRKEDFANREEG